MQQVRDTSSNAEMQWHALSVARVWKELSSDENRGISQQEAKKRLEHYGLNQLAQVQRASAWQMLLEQCKNVLVIILIIAVGLSAVLGHIVEAIAIGIIVLFSVLLGFIQEYRAERAIEALKKMAAPTATVLRDGEEIEIDAETLVPGDVIILSTGDRIPADARVYESASLQLDEAALTGESLPVEKHSEQISETQPSLGDRKNMLYAGTSVTYGRGRAVVTATGMHTEFGKIAGMLQSVESSSTPLQDTLDHAGKTLAKAALAIVIIIGGLGLLHGEGLLDMIIFGIALAVAVVPEALPAVVTISLAIGVQRMVKRHALVRRLPAVETLGSVSIICSDKTGTLTKDEMTVRKIFTAREMIDVSGSGYEPHGTFTRDAHDVQPSEALLELLRAAVLASDATLQHHPDEGWTVKGDPTEGAMIVAAAKAKLQKDLLDREFPRTAEIPFTSETKRMTTLHASGNSVVGYSKGAPEVILDSCTHIRLADGVHPLTEKERTEILAASRTMATSALRVLAVATTSHASLERAERGMTFLGLFGMIDPPRPEAKNAVEECKKAGVRVIMITGDHPITAEAVARELGILDGGTIVTGADLEAMDDATFAEKVESIDVYARVSPAHKLRVVAALQAKGHIIAMTGDGVNDAPSLKKADIGIAMGITGTDVTKEAGAMMLTDDNFASIVAAIEEGRGIFSNIKKYLMYLLSSNIGEICLMFAASVLGLPLPLSAVQLLYVNLATDGLPALALAVDPPDHDLMRRPPRNPRQSIFTPAVTALMITGGLWSMIVNVSIFAWMFTSGAGLEEAMTMTFASLILIQFFKAYSFRSDRHSVFLKPFANKWLNLSVLWELLLLIAIIEVPFLHTFFGTYSLPLRDWVWIIGLSATVIPVLELAKYMTRHWHEHLSLTA